MNLNILLVEDNLEDAQFIQRLLASDPGTEYFLIFAQTLTEATRHLQGNIVDLVLLDLTLPDSEGQDTVTTLRQTFPDIPLIALTGKQFSPYGLEALQDGAQDYLDKQTLKPEWLFRSIRYVRERDLLREQIEHEKALREKHQATLRMPARLSGQPLQTAFPHLKDNKISLEESVPIVFQDMIQQLGQAFDAAMDHDAAQAPSLVDQLLSALSQRLTDLHAGPRDIVNLYRRTLQKKMVGTYSTQQEACFQTGRFLILRLMGNVLSSYRFLAISQTVRKPAAPSDPSISWTSLTPDSSS